MADDTDIPTVTVREWTDLVRRARLGRTIKATALLLATYADYRTGRRVHPGLARIAHEGEMHYTTAKRAVAELRRIGLILLVSRAHSHGGADDYRLIIGPDVLEHLDVPTPAAEEVAIDRIRGVHRKGARVPAPPVQDATARVGAAPVQDAARVPAPPVQQADEPDRTGAPATRADGCTGALSASARVPSAPRINQDHPQPLTPNSGDVDRNHQTAREPAADEPDPTGEGEQPTGPTEQPLPDRCEHGFPARRRPDGSSSCALCRRAAGYQPPPPPNAVPRTTRPTLTLVKPA